MYKENIRRLIADRLEVDGLVETGITGVKLFKVSSRVRCAPAIYEPAIIAIVNGSKEAILDGNRYVYDENQYMCCSMSMPVEAGTPTASPDNPLLGVYVSLDTKVMTELSVELEYTLEAKQKPPKRKHQLGLELANWDAPFGEALLRLVKLSEDATATKVLGSSRLRELYYAVLTGGAGGSARRAFGAGSEIARVIDHISSHLDRGVTIEEIAARVGMSRAALHRKFKQTTSMSPIQFIKSMRLNAAAMKIAQGRNVNLAAMEVGYSSASQFSREFKRMYGKSPRLWRQTMPDSQAVI
ncbi:AraC family transcriptional regulator [Arenicella chitinivorans]|uniref:AraC family transcriptional regulator n=1 Tax=Arenicella chitinivorans TaxID=1329800 RepID=A0A918VNC4_9GAMM|nr:AraC family transcriptional regulator [Arenicella chitinivorans]GHA12239.1 AraC family transcriptional regulator [Arenicella chitinivorans]